MAVSPVFLLGAYSFIVLSCAACIFFLIEILRAIWNTERKEKLKFSIILKYYFCVLLTMSVLMFIHTTTILIIWKNDLNFPFLPFFLTGTIDASFMPVIPFTFVMLTLDRCLILLLEHKYKQSWTILVLCSSIIINFIVAGVNLIMNILFHDSELPEGCAAYGCVLHINTQLVYTYIRTLGAVLGITVGIVFLITTMWLRKKQPEIGNKVKAIAEAVVLRAVIFGLLCDFGPHVFDAIVISITDDTPFKYIGPYSRVIMAIDLLLNSTINWFTFMRMKKTVTAVEFTVTTTSTRNH